MPTIGHKHLTLIKQEKGKNTYKVHCTEKNTYNDVTSGLNVV